MATQLDNIKARRRSGVNMNFRTWVDKAQPHPNPNPKVTAVVYLRGANYNYN